MPSSPGPGTVTDMTSTPAAGAAVSTLTGRNSTQGRSGDALSGALGMTGPATR
jgi:hypothetical protein